MPSPPPIGGGGESVDPLLQARFRRTGEFERKRLDPRRVRLAALWTDFDETQGDRIVLRVAAQTERGLEQGRERFDPGIVHLRQRVAAGENRAAESFPGERERVADPTTLGWYPIRRGRARGEPDFQHVGRS